MRLVQIKCNGEMNDLDVSINSRNIKKVLGDISIEKGTKQIQQLYSWAYEGSIVICYGWITGTPGKENKHDLPPSGNKCDKLLDNSDTQLLFGDQFILTKKNNIFTDFDVSDYGLFYSMCFEGFDECLTDDETDSEEDNGSDLDDFIVSDGLDDDLDCDLDCNLDCESDDKSDDNLDDDSDDSDEGSEGELDEDLNEY